MTTGSRHRWAVLTSLAVALALPGCAGGQESVPGGSATIPGSGPIAAADTTTAAPTPITTAMATDVVAAIPPAARYRTADGAEAFVRYFLQVTNDVSVNPRVGLLPQLSTPSCKTCRGWERQTASLIAGRKRYRGASLSVDAVAGLDGRPETDSTYSVAAIVREGESPIVDQRGAEVARAPRRRSTLEFELIWRTGRWNADAVRLLRV